MTFTFASLAAQLTFFERMNLTRFSAILSVVSTIFMSGPNIPANTVTERKQEKLNASPRRHESVVIL
jgi:hypothetical protein